MWLLCAVNEELHDTILALHSLFLFINQPYSQYWNSMARYIFEALGKDTLYGKNLFFLFSLLSGVCPTEEGLRHSSLNASTIFCRQTRQAGRAMPMLTTMRTSRKTMKEMMRK